MTSIASPGLRERKAAKLKLLLVELLEEELKSSAFQDINVETLCEKAMISKVTFYNYFPEKDDIIRYFLSLWVYRIIIDCHNLNKSGFAVIQYFFEDMIKNMNRNPNLYGNMISILTRKPKFDYVEELTLAERAALYPDKKLHTLEVKLSMGQFIQTHCKTAISKGEITDAYSPEDLSLMIGSLLHGSCILGYRINVAKPGEACLNAYRILNSILER